jgi:hypothetical protein
MEAKKQAATAQFTQVYGKHKATAPNQVKREMARLTEKGSK